MDNSNLFGFLNIYKPTGMTSHDVVGYLRRVTRIKQIGHAGTLDPFAEGVLSVAIGKSTRLIEYLDDDKAYIGRFCFGKSTDTYDIEGEVVETYDKRVSQEDIKYNLQQGEIEQYPPIYSAKKVDGKKLYEYAREGKTVEIKPCRVVIYKSEILEFNESEQWADIYIECSKGTYIRSIANDLGKSLNSGCYLSRLKRVKSGKFDVETSVELEMLKTPQDVKSNLLNPVDYLNYNSQELNEVEYKRVSNGRVIYNRIDAKEGEIVLLVKDNNLIAIAQATDEGLSPKKVISV